MTTVNWDSGYLKTLTIASGATESDVLDLRSLRTRRPLAILFVPLDTLTGTWTIQVAETPDDTFVTLQSGGSDVTIPSAKGTQVDAITAGALKLVTNSAPGADQDVRLVAGSRK